MNVAWGAQFSAQQKCSVTHFKKKIVSFILKIKRGSGGRQILSSTDSPIDCSSQVWAMLKPEAGNSTQISYMGNGNPSNWTIICCSSTCVCRELGKKWNSQDSDPYSEVECRCFHWKLSALCHNTSPYKTYLHGSPWKNKTECLRGTWLATWARLLGS